VGWTWDIGDLPVGGEAVLQLSAQGITTGDWTNRVDVAGAEVDTRLADNLATWVNVVRPASDLSVGASVLQSLVLLGRPTMVDLVLTNQGPDTAEQVLVTNRFSGGALLEIVETGWEVRTNSPSEVVWSVDTLAPGAEASLRITLIPTDLQGMTNHLEVTGEVVDAVPENNAFSLEVPVYPLARLQVSQSPNRDPVMLDDYLRYFLTVSSASAYTLDSVVARNTLPEGAVFVEAVTSQGTSALQGDTLVADLGALGPGEAATVELTVRPQQLGIATNVVLLQAIEADPTDPSLRSTSTVAVVETPPLAIEWTGSAVLVSWPAIAGDYRLERASSLVEGDWQPDLNTPRLSSDGERLMILFRAALAERFYRLSKSGTP
jgi:hypothetical protein